MHLESAIKTQRILCLDILEPEESNNFGTNSNLENIHCSNLYVKNRLSMYAQGHNNNYETNKILFNFIWKGKDKVKQSTLISNMEKGGLRVLHLELAIKTQQI